MYWNIVVRIIKKISTNDKDIDLDDIMNKDDSLNEEEIDFIKKNEEELN